MQMLGKNLRAESKFVVYGPFNYGGAYTCESNREFDESLRLQDAKMGIRNFEDVVKGMQESGFSLLKDYEMPANNRMLVFIKAEMVQ
jgi:hypothetical protein